MHLGSLVAPGLGMASSSLATSPFPPTPTGLTIKDIAAHPGVSISYKETHICEDHAKAFAGYVHMPVDYTADVQGDDPYNISMFFWYFEARNRPEQAPTVIYLAGGPGESSMFGAVSDDGPCYIGTDSNSSYSNEWSWNNDVNMLYLDQPISSGFSYDSLVNSTFDFTFLGGETLSDTGIVAFEAYNGSVPEANSTFAYGTFPSQNPLHTANSSTIAARTVWHFSQIWFSEFPEWRTCNKKISFWGNSYGGYWVAASAAYTQSQNVKVETGSLSGIVIEIDTAGITNGCIDLLYQGEAWVQLAYNNTYDLEVINKTIYETALNDWSKHGGCREQMLECRALAAQYDPDQLNINSTVSGKCTEAVAYCYANIQGPYDVYSNRSVFDMANMEPNPFPPYWAAEYFNTAWVQQELGVPLNFTPDSTLSDNVVVDVGGDPVRFEGMKSIEYLLDSGIKVALMYGDRDYRCPWLGAETLSLQANWTGGEDFRGAGYEFIHTNDSYNGGLVRQHGNLSFSRVFEAGHDVSAYQPETSFKIFNRVMFDRDVAKGQLSTAGPFNNYTTQGPQDTWWYKNVLPPSPDPICELYNLGLACTEGQYLALLNGTAEIVSAVVVKPDGSDGIPLLLGGAD